MVQISVTHKLSYFICGTLQSTSSSTLQPAQTVSKEDAIRTLPQLRHHPIPMNYKSPYTL